MGLRQQFGFKYSAASEVQEFLRTFSHTVIVEDRDDFFVFTQKDGPRFSLDCGIVPTGLLSERSGEYFEFLGQFVEGLTGRFGPVEMEDA